MSFEEKYGKNFELYWLNELWIRLLRPKWNYSKWFCFGENICHMPMKYNVFVTKRKLESENFSFAGLYDFCNHLLPRTAPTENIARASPLYGQFCPAWWKNCPSSATPEYFAHASWKIWKWKKFGRKFGPGGTPGVLQGTPGGTPRVPQSSLSCLQSVFLISRTFWIGLGALLWSSRSILNFFWKIWK